MSADKRIDELTAVTPVAADLIAVYDISNPGTKKITLQQVSDLLAPVGGLTTIYPIAPAGTTVTVAALIGKTIKLLLRGGIGSGEVITSGIPAGEQILFNSITGLLTAANPFVGETLTIQYA